MEVLPLIAVFQEASRDGWRIVHEGLISPPYPESWQALGVAMKLCKAQASLLIFESASPGSVQAWHFVPVVPGNDLFGPWEVGMAGRPTTAEA